MVFAACRYYIIYNVCLTVSIWPKTYDANFNGDL